MTLIEKNSELKEKEKEKKKDNRIPCPSCGRKDMLRSQGRCVICLNCGYGTCSI